jgi:hypothetical protein
MCYKNNEKLFIKTNVSYERNTRQHKFILASNKHKKKSEKH